MEKLPKKLLIAAMAKKFWDGEFEKAAKSVIQTQEKKKIIAIKAAGK